MIGRLLIPPRCVACDAPASALFCELCAVGVSAGPAIQLPGFTSVTACFELGGPVEEAIRKLKQGGREDVGAAFGRALRSAVEPGECVVPVPGDPKRTRMRGFNPPSTLARAIGAAVLWSAARRCTSRPPQRGLGRAERARNVEGVFRAGNIVRGRALVIVDDVITTGATARALGAALIEAGADRCRLLALAHADR